MLPPGAVPKVRSYKKKIKKKNGNKRSCIKKLKRTPSLLTLPPGAVPKVRSYKKIKKEH
jgi:hypothetical protein